MSDEVAALAAELAAEGEGRRQIPDQLSDAIRDAGLYRMLVPASLGGGEVELAEMVEALEALGGADGSAGWCAMVAATAGLALGHLSPEAGRGVFPDPATVIVGVFAPRGVAERDGAHLRASGRWPFASNIGHADWVLGGARVRGEDSPRLLVMPRAEVEVLDTWRVAGLCGTGSNDFAADGIRVPAALAVDPSAPARESGALYAVPMLATLALGIAAVALGIARGALDDLAELAGAKVPTGSRRKLSEREAVQAALARARGEVAAGRALLLTEAAAAFTEARRREVTLERRIALRLAATHAAHASVRATDEAFSHAGAGSVYLTSSLQRRFRDIHVAAQHMMVAPPTYELIGRAELGLDVDGRGL